MNAPLRHVPLSARSNKPLTPSLEKERLRLSLVLMICDLLAIFGCFLLVGGLYLDDWPSEMALREAVLLAPLFLLFGIHGGLYKPDLLYEVRRSIYRLIYIATISSFFLIFATFYAKTTESFSRVVFTFGCATAVLTIAAIRIGALQFIKRRIGPSLHNVMVLYAGGPPVEMKHAFHIDAAEHGLTPDIADPANLDRVGYYMQNMDRVIVSCAADDRELWSPLLKMAGVQGEFVSDAMRKLGALRVTNGGGISTIVVAVKPLGLEARLTKRAMDLVLSGAALLALSPLMAVVALLIKLEDGGRVFFRQRRMGEGNRFFSIYKFRSMRSESGDADGNRSASRDDDRTTQIGRLIRRTSIDELPQLFNVWRGDMSLVGPRPHALGSQAGEKLFWEIDGRYWNRHVLKPGVTGLAQIRGFRGATEQERDLTDRLQADLEYISNWSLWLDLRILIKTVFVIFHENAY